MSTAALVNNCRVIAILVHEIVLNQIAYLDFQSPIVPRRVNADNRTSSLGYQSQIHQQIKSSQETILELIKLICASIPFLLDYECCASVAPLKSQSLHPRAAGGNAVIWPIYVAAQIPFVSPLTRAWTIGRLNKIGTEMGVRKQP